MEPVLVIEVHKAGKDFPCLVSLIQACTIPKWSHNGVFNLVSQHRAVLPSYACKNIKKRLCFVAYRQPQAEGWIGKESSIFDKPGHKYNLRNIRNVIRILEEYRNIKGLINILKRTV